MTDGGTANDQPHRFSEASLNESGNAGAEDPTPRHGRVGDVWEGIKADAGWSDGSSQLPAGAPQTATFRACSHCAGVFEHSAQTTSEIVRYAVPANPRRRPVEAHQLHDIGSSVSTSPVFGIALGGEMMRALVIYESLWGNTEKVTRAIATRPSADKCRIILHPRIGRRFHFEWCNKWVSCPCDHEPGAASCAYGPTKQRQPDHANDSHSRHHIPRKGEGYIPYQNGFETHDHV